MVDDDVGAGGGGGGYCEGNDTVQVLPPSRHHLRHPHRPHCSLELSLFRLSSPCLLRLFLNSQRCRDWQNLIHNSDNEVLRRVQRLNLNCDRDLQHLTQKGLKFCLCPLGMLVDQTYHLLPNKKKRKKYVFGSISKTIKVRTVIFFAPYWSSCT